MPSPFHYHLLRNILSLRRKAAAKAVGRKTNPAISIIAGFVIFALSGRKRKGGSGVAGEKLNENILQRRDPHRREVIHHPYKRGSRKDGAIKIAPPPQGTLAYLGVLQVWNSVKKPIPPLQQASNSPIAAK